MFATELKRLRKKLGHTQETFAETIGVTRQSVQKWEAGTGTLGVKRWHVIEKELGMPKGWVSQIIVLDAFGGTAAEYAKVSEPSRVRQGVAESTTATDARIEKEQQTQRELWQTWNNWT